MTLGALVDGLAGVRLHGAAGVDVRGVAADSREVGAGFLFAALPGAATDGRRFVADALARGAAAILGPASAAADRPAGVPFVEADSPRRALADICRRFHGAPDQRLALIGVTGTNGKTTTAHLLAAALGAAARPTAVGGTLGLRAGSFTAPPQLTTPEAPALWSFLARAVQEGCAAAAIEVSSAALVADRVHGMQFAGAILTGVGRDHLDLHGTPEAYVAAKALLFEMLAPAAFAVLPADDPQSALFRRATRARVVTFGEAADADWRLGQHRPDAAGAEFQLDGPEFSRRVRTARPGPWDARNLAAAVAAAVALGVPAETAVDGAAGVAGLDGRWERVDQGQAFAALVDYAHTPEALERTLTLLRRVTAGRVIVVFGCGGERDRGKRPAMGRIVGQLADLALVTDDNPRGEDPETIARDVMAGLTGTKAQARRVAGRAEAIRAAVLEARPGDAVLVAGKGHETYQEIAGVRRRFDDREQLRAALSCLGARS